VGLFIDLYNARKDHMPTVAIVGQQARKSLGTDYQQELDLMALFKDVASEYVQMVTEPAQDGPLAFQAQVNPRPTRQASHGCGGWFLTKDIGR
jgi:thiamine pyrophosphate-dependent acetolactate synthase large subunit-like protein